MAYTTINFKTKKALKEALAAGKKISVFQPNNIFNIKLEGHCTLEGPHYPEPHKWYASAKLDENGYIISVK